MISAPHVCSFYQIERACVATPSSADSIPMFDTKFRKLRNYFNDTRCRMLTQLAERQITGLDFIRAFEQAPELIERMRVTGVNECDADFIDQLTDLTHQSLLASPYPCEPPSHAPQADVIFPAKFVHIQRESSLPPQLSRLASLSKSSIKFDSIQSLVAMPLERAVPPSSTLSVPRFVSQVALPPRTAALSQPSLPHIASHHSAGEGFFSMGYQWKGEDD